VDGVIEEVLLQYYNSSFFFFFFSLFFSVESLDKTPKRFVALLAIFSFPFPSPPLSLFFFPFLSLLGLT